MTWKWEAPAGVYKNHALSSKIREEAAAKSVFAQYCMPEPGYGKRKGESITITRVMQLPLATKVSEIEVLPSGRPAIDTVDVSVSEWGFKIECTDYEKNLTHYDIDNPFQRMLRDQMSLTVDKMVADAFKMTNYKAVCQNSASLTTSTTVGGALPSETAAVPAGLNHMKDLHDALSGDLKCPPMSDGFYMLVGTTNFCRGIKNDPEFKDWFAPTTRDPAIRGHIGDLENFHVVETNHFNALDNAIGTSDVTGEAIAFGMDATFLAEVDTPRIRRGLSYDLGRKTEVGWVGTMEAGIVWPEASLARCIHITSTDAT